MFHHGMVKKNVVGTDDERIWGRLTLICTLGIVYATWKEREHRYDFITKVKVCKRLLLIHLFLKCHLTSKKFYWNCFIIFYFILFGGDCRDTNMKCRMREGGWLTTRLPSLSQTGDVLVIWILNTSQLGKLVTY